jgi:hypothetical protein
VEKQSSHGAPFFGTLGLSDVRKDPGGVLAKSLYVGPDGCAEGFNTLPVGMEKARHWQTRIGPLATQKALAMTWHVHTGDVKDVTHWPIRPALIIADPPYGDIVPEAWDKADVNAWIGLFLALHHITDPGVPIYWWGGIGKPKARAFFEFIVRAERETAWRMRDLITWKKKRAYGTEGDYLFTREECAIFVHGEAKGAKGAPPYRRFVKPYLTEKRGYDGFGEHKAHSEYKRRSNVWDETELMSGSCSTERT